MEGKISKELSINWCDAKQLVSEARSKGYIDDAELHKSVLDIWSRLPQEEQERLQHNRGAFQRKRKVKQGQELKKKMEQQAREKKKKEYMKSQQKWSGGGDWSHPAVGFGHFLNALANGK